MRGPTFVLVPGAGGSAWFWNRVEAVLHARGHASVAVELPAADEAAGLPEYVDLVVAAADGHDDVVVVGQSLGGFSASAAAARLPTRRLVLLNAMVPAPGETAGQWWTATGQSAAMRELDRREGRDPDAGFDLRTYFLHDVEPDVADEMARHGSEESDAVFAAPWDLVSWPAVPTRVVVGRDDRFFPADFQRRVARDRIPDPELVEVPGGHLAALSRPVEVAEALFAP